MLVPLAAHSLLEIILVRSIANKINKAVTMNRFFLILTLSILASSALTLPTLAAAPKYKADVPDYVLTPDSVQTKYAGELTFVDGFPTDKTLVKTNDFMDTARALWLTPNTTTPYVHAEIDVKNGPVVIEIGSPVISIIDDAYFKFFSRYMI